MKKLPSFFAAWIFITTFTKAATEPYLELGESSPYPHKLLLEIDLSSMLLVTTLRSPKQYRLPFIFSRCAACPEQLIPLDLITLVIMCLVKEAFVCVTNNQQAHIHRIPTFLTTPLKYNVCFYELKPV
jgi:hypothetical protein